MSAGAMRQKVNSEDGKDFIWTTDVNVELPIFMEEFGPASEPPTTICNVFRSSAAKWRKKICMK